MNKEKLFWGIQSTKLSLNPDLWVKILIIRDDPSRIKSIIYIFYLNYFLNIKSTLQYHHRRKAYKSTLKWVNTKNNKGWTVCFSFHKVVYSDLNIKRKLGILKFRSGNIVVADQEIWYVLGFKFSQNRPSAQTSI